MVKSRPTTIEPEIGCDPVCAAKPDWNTTAPPIGDLPKSPHPSRQALAVRPMFFSWRS
jgi:hypothetical protein